MEHDQDQEISTEAAQDPTMNANADVADLLAMAMETETDEHEGGPSAATTEEPMSPAPPTPAVAFTGNFKLSKNFALNDTKLFSTFTDKEQNQIFYIPKSRQIAKKTEDGFEMVEKEATKSPFVSAAIVQAQRTRTENNAATFSTSGDARIDFFFHVIEQTEPEKTVGLLSEAWETDDLSTLKLIASLRDIKDGKGIRRQYQHCLYWLYENHPKTLFENLPTLLEFGYWKDGLHFLMTVLFRGFVHPYFASDDGVKNLNNYPKPKVRKARQGKAGKGGVKHGRVARRKVTDSTKKAKPRQQDCEKRIYNQKILDYYKVKEDILDVSAKEMAAMRLKFARDRFERDPKYRAFHILIAQTFAKQLQKDFVELSKLTQAGTGDGDGETKKKPNLNLSLVGKWAPTLEGHFDRYTLVASTIALEFVKLLNKIDILSKPRIPVAVYLARKFYNKSACIPLRAQLEIPERAMSQNEWEKVNYARVAAKCMKLNKELFILHDKERFEAYVKKDGAKVAGATLKPIEIIKEAMRLADHDKNDTEKIVVEKQWQSLADDIKKKGGALLSDAIAVCDVSGSMEGDPMDAAIGLTLLTMNMSAAPWNEVCITFHESPTMFHLPSTFELSEKITALKAMPWGGSTNLQAVFQQIVDLGRKNKLTAEQMPKILLIFTDMEFDQACQGSAKTNFEYAKKQFTEHGYTLPSIVFWNLRDAPGKNSTPVQIDERGTILLSGWSGQLLSFIMSQKDLATCTPWSFVKELMDKEKYNGLKIYD